jgi:glyoxylate reductase
VELGEFAGRVQQVSWGELVESRDYLFLHMPLTEQTHHLADAGVLARMKSGAILINTAHGPVVDETALAAAPRKGAIAGAGLDIHEHGHALVPGMANTVRLPHIGSATIPVRAAMSRLNAMTMAMATGQRRPLINPEATPSRSAGSDRGHTPNLAVGSPGNQHPRPPTRPMALPHGS